MHVKVLNFTPPSKENIFSFKLTKKKYIKMYLCIK